MSIVPPLKMQGIKTRLVLFIRDNIAWDGNGRWVEPFVGSGAVLFNVKPKRALAGDTNCHIIRFYQSIQSGLISGHSARRHLEREGCRLFEAGEEHYYRVRARFNEDHDPLDFLFLNRACFNGLMRFNGKGQFNTPFCRKPERFRRAYISRICNQIDSVANAMKGLDWKFVCSDWSATLDQVAQDDFVYADPPYAGRFTDYFNGWTDEEAEKLERRLKQLPCQFLYSMWAENKYGKNDRLYRSFPDHDIKTLDHFYHLGSTESLRNSMKEALVLG